ncbi:MAG: enoyl-CoA hydratase [Alphaproteobacteria bacterium]|nr:enoyl-CoA hydratase [Alphaproteobacteria bacterium]
MSTALVAIELQECPEGRVARITLRRPEKRNALSREAAEQLIEAFAELKQDARLRLAVLTGAGDKAFIGGADLNDLAGLDRASARGFIAAVHGVCAGIRALPVPVLGRINGYCLGAGLEIAAACDLRIAADNAVFGMPEVRVGLPSVVEAALLPCLVGWGKAREIVYLARNYGAQEALAMGLVGRVVPAPELDAAVAEWSADILAAAPQAIRLQKALIAEWEAGPLDRAILAGIDALAAAYAGDEPARYIAALRARRR